MAPDNVYIIVIGMFTLVIGYDIFNWLRYRSFTTPEIRLQRFRSTVNFSVFILGCTLIVASVCFHINIFGYSRPIEYQHIDTITLQDFKGYRLPNQTLHGDEEFAFITTSIEWEKNDKEIEIKCLFHPSRSYIYNEKIVNKFLLQHELYHFHITEYFARLSRKEIQTFSGVPSDTEIEEIIQRNKMAENAMQREYDYETYHGYILKEQNGWKERVDSLLTLQDAFKNPVIIF